MFRRKTNSCLLKMSRVYCSKCQDQTGSFQSQRSLKRELSKGSSRKFTITYSLFLSITPCKAWNKTLWCWIVRNYEKLLLKPLWSKEDVPYGQTYRFISKQVIYIRHNLHLWLLEELTDKGSSSGTGTNDHRINTPAFYQLS